MALRYHLRNWEYFIEMSCFIPNNMIEILSNSLKLLNVGVSGAAFSRITDAAKCARTVEGLETIMLLTLQDYIGKNMTEGDPLLFDKFLENIDDQLTVLKEDWAIYHNFS